MQGPQGHSGGPDDLELDALSLCSAGATAPIVVVDRVLLPAVTRGSPLKPLRGALYSIAPLRQNEALAFCWQVKIPHFAGWVFQQACSQNWQSVVWSVHLQ